jgi:hypothetical protein
MKNSINLLILIFFLLSCSVNVSNSVPLIDPNMEWFAEGIPVRINNNISRGYAVEIDSKNNNYIIGEYQDTITLGDFTLNQQLDRSNQGFIAKADEKGNWLWAKNVNGSFCLDSNTMVIDRNDNVYIAGYPKDSLFVENVKIDLPGNKHIFIAKFAPSGELIWVKSAFIAEKSDGFLIERLSINSKGVLYLSGNCSPTAYFGEYVIHGESEKREGFIATISPEGEWLSSEIMQHAEYDIRYLNDIAIDNDDNVFLAGVIDGYTAFISKWDRNHELQWFRTVYSDEGADIFQISVDSSSNVNIVGSCYGVVSFGHITKKTGQHGDFTFVAKFDNNGKFTWVNIASSEIFFRQQIIVDESGNCYVKGSFTESMKVGRRKITIRANISPCAFIWKIKPNGRTSILKRVGLYSDLSILGFKIDNNNDLILTGSFYDWGTHRGLRWSNYSQALFLSKYKP